MDTKTDKHVQICARLSSMYEKKNADYGDAFSQAYEELGIITALTRISDKFNRAKNLIKSGKACIETETVKDTLLDMANYCIMTVMEMEAEEEP